MQPNAIRALRRRNGWTQAELAGRLDTDAVTVSRWERGISRPRPSAQARLRSVSGPWPEVSALVEVTGDAEARRLLRRLLLLRRRPTKQRLAANPTQRLRDVDRARREQEEMKARMRLPQ